MFTVFTSVWARELKMSPIRILTIFSPEEQCFIGREFHGSGFAVNRLHHFSPGEDCLQDKSWLDAIRNEDFRAGGTLEPESAYRVFVVPGCDEDFVAFEAGEAGRGRIKTGVAARGVSVGYHDSGRHEYIWADLQEADIVYPGAAVRHLVHHRVARVEVEIDIFEKRPSLRD